MPLLQVVREYSGWAEIVWAVDRASLDRTAFRQLSRFGLVCDIGGAERPATGELAGVGIDGVLAFADAQLIRAAELAGTFGLPGNSPETALRLVDKVAQRRALHAGGVPVPRFAELDAASPTLRDDIESMVYPAVLKPAIGAGGRGTFVIADAADATSRLADLRAAGDRQTMILEECLGGYPPCPRGPFGDYVSVESVVSAGRVTTVQVVGRMPTVPDFRETGAFAPAYLADADAAAVAQTATDAAHALGVTAGCLHTEIKLTPDGPRIVEVNGRIGGGGIPAIVADTTGVSMYRCAALAALGREIRVDPQPAGSISYALALQPPLGTPASLAPGWSDVLGSIDGVGHIEARTERITAAAADGSYGYLVMMSGRAARPAGLVDAYRTLYSVLATD